MPRHGASWKGKDESSSTIPIGFFRIIKPTILSQGKMNLPDKFVNGFGAKLSSVASLTVPSGDVWAVGLERVENKILFVGNLKEFMEFYGIGDFYFLVFKYMGDSNFEVVICDMTAAEIPYRLRTLARDEAARAESTCPEESASLEFGILISSNDEGEDIESSEHPHFLAIVEKHDSIDIPCEFAGKYLSSSLAKQSVKLQNSNKGTRQWDALCVSKNTADSSDKTIDEGWGRFCSDNNVTPGVVCKFELIKKKPIILFKIAVYRAT